VRLAGARRHPTMAIPLSGAATRARRTNMAGASFPCDTLPSMARHAETSSVAQRPPSEPPPEYAEDGVDLTLLRWMASLTPTERLAVLQQNVAAVQRLLDARAER